MALPIKELANLTNLVEYLKSNDVIVEVRIIKGKKVVFNAKFTPELLNLLSKFKKNFLKLL